MSNSDAITRGVRVQVKCEYLESESLPENRHYLFSYHVTISNHSEQAVQLISRHWVITNSDGKKEEVRGLGVIGQQPLIRPGETYSYSSFCPLDTPVGSMYGTYQMVLNSGEEFDATIAPFTLALPDILN